MKAAQLVLMGLAFTAHAALAQHAEHEHGQHSHHEMPAASESRHVAPPAPEQPLPDMSNERMIELMEMNDTAAFGMLLIDQLEWRDADRHDALAWDAQAWFGNDYNKARFKSEGERTEEQSQVRTELLWDRIVSRWWNAQAGMRHDFNDGPSRTWAALGIQGLAPYGFDVEATLYIGEQGRSAFRASAESSLLLTQRLILQPRVELNLYGKDDAANGIGAGLSDTQIALRLRYEIRREIAPYLGLVWDHLYGDTADFASLQGRERNEVQLVAGLRVWF
jgi:copper resistance protein B